MVAVVSHSEAGWLPEKTGVLCKVDGIMKEEKENLRILQQSHKSSSNWLKCGSTFFEVFQQDNDPKGISKLDVEWIKLANVKLLEPRKFWSVFKSQVHARKPTHLIEHYQLCQVEWSPIQPEFCQKLADGNRKC